MAVDRRVLGTEVDCVLTRHGRQFAGEEVYRLKAHWLEVRRLRWLSQRSNRDWYHARFGCSGMRSCWQYFLSIVLLK